MKKRVKITIPSGQTFGTKIVDEETGEEISNVFNVEFRHRVNELPTLKIERYLLDEDVEITGEAEIVDWAIHARGNSDDQDR